MGLTKRIDLNVGFECNSNCVFCYYNNLRNNEMPSFENLKKKLELARRLGMETVEFTGGEPTTREDIFQLVAYARRLGFKRMGMISNGISFQNSSIAKAAKEAGLEEIKLSIHGAEAKVHEAVTRTPGSFKSLVKGITNIKKAGLKIKTNTIITRINYKSLPKIASFLRKLKPARVNFKFVTPILDAEKLGTDTIVKYSEAKPYLRKAITFLQQDSFKVTVRYMPFCFLPEYESNICNLSQVQYDLDEWDYIAKNKIEYGFLISKLNQAIGYIGMIMRLYFPQKDISHRAVIESKLLRMATKNKACTKCKYDLVCDGLWKRYAKLYGYDELKPIVGTKIRCPRG